MKTSGRAACVALAVTALVGACGGSCGHVTHSQPMSSTAPLAGSWSPIATGGAPQGAGSRHPVWSGRELLVWGGVGPCTPLGFCGSGARYHPARDLWTPITDAGAPAPRDEHASAWAGDRLFVWGGRGCGGIAVPCGDGGLYDPGADAWTPVEEAGAPSARGWAVSVWTGREIVVWGGENPAGGALLGDGGRFDPAARLWRSIAAEGAPGARRYHTMVWTGREVIVWGGDGDVANGAARADAAAYDPVADRWRPIASEGAPAARWAAGAIWTGTELVIWGGLGCGRDQQGGPALCGDGGRYDPAANRWQPLAREGAPSPRVGHSAVWTGTEMLVWGGTSARCADGSAGACADGAAYDPSSDRWRALVTAAAVPARSGHASAWTGQSMLVWGGTGGGESERALSSGSLFTPAD